MTCNIDTHTGLCVKGGCDKHEYYTLLKRLEDMGRKSDQADLIFSSMTEVRIKDIENNGKSQFDIDCGYNQAVDDFIKIVKEMK